MTTRTRYFLVGATLILLVGLGTGLVAYYGGGLSVLGGAPGSEELSYMPADAAIVAYANVKQIMASQFRQRIQQALPTGAERDQFQQETGIDVERDIDSVMASVGSGDAKDESVAVVRGTFNQTQIEAAARQHGAGTEATYGGVKLLTLGSDNAGDHAAVAFLGSGLLAVGSEPAVRHAIDAHAGAGIAGNAEMMKLIQGARGASHTVWAVGQVSKLPHTESLPDPVKQQLPTVQWFTLAAHIDDGVSGEVSVEARDKDAADNLRAVVNGGLAIARLQTGKNQQLDNVINSLQLSGTGTTVELSFTVPASVLDMINGAAGLANLAKHSGGGRP